MKRGLQYKNSPYKNQTCPTWTPPGRRSCSPAELPPSRHWSDLEHLWQWGPSPDTEFVKNFTPPDFQAKNFTPPISPNFNSVSEKKHKKWVKIEKFTPLAKILHCRRRWRYGQISPLMMVAVILGKVGRLDRFFVFVVHWLNPQCLLFSSIMTMTKSKVEDSVHLI